MAAPKWKIPCPYVLCIAGPTAVGKSAVALQAARRLNGEIVSADSMQIYKGMDIGTGKPGRAARRQIPHHLVDYCAFSRLFSVHDYQRAALQAIRDIARRGHLPVVTGGSGLYVRALLQGLETSPPPDYARRKKWEAQARRYGAVFLHRQLAKADPQAAARLKEADERRLIRALEVARSGRLKNPAQPPLPSLAQTGFVPVVVGLRRERALLYSMIEKRVDQMFRQGWVREARKLSKMRISRTARQALGYRHLWDRMKRGRPLTSAVLQESRKLIKRDTRRYAKRQMTWFRREPGLIWLDWQPGETAASAANRLCKLFLGQIQA